MMALIRNNRVLFASLAVLVVALACAAVYVGPDRFPRTLRAAAQNRDTIRLEQLIDFPAVRDGLKSDLKTQMAAALARQAAAQPAAATSSGADAGSLQGPSDAAIDQIIDQTVTSQGLAQVVADPAGPGQQLLDGLFPKDRSGLRFRVSRRYLAFDRFRYTLASTGGKSSVDVDLERQGLLRWRVERITPYLDLASLQSILAPPAAAPAPPSAPEEASQTLSAPPPPPTGSAAAADGLPTQVGQCANTTIKDVSTRLDGVPDSGSAVDFTNGGYQVSYDQVPAVDQSQAGDPIDLCLVSLPENCPPGDDRGKTYKATNLRTGDSWTLPDSEHMCGGA